MANINFTAVKSYAVASFASLYCAVMLFALSGANGAEVGALIV
ncbi:hypothetical protein [Sphingopyxis sp. MWB1]|nr:hypothetical protein [Sphingopyxis sp. MWB1]